MARNVDLEALKKLGYSADPIPGDPASIADAVQYLAALAKKADAASTRLAGLVKDGPYAALVGESATELRKHVKDQLKLFVDKLNEAVTLASNALTTFSTALGAAQRKAQPAIDGAAALPVNDPGLAAHKATLEAARTDYVTAYNVARDALVRATGLRTSPKTVSEEFWDFFKIFTIVLTVLGVLFGGPLGLLAFGANLVVLGKTIADFVQGRASGLELFLNILGVLFPTTKALLPALLSGLKNLLVGIGKGAVNLFKGGANFLSLLGTGLKGFNLAGWKFAAIYAGIVAGGLIFKGGLFVAKLIALPFKAIVWTAKAGWAAGKAGFAELKGWGSLGILLPVAGNEIKVLGLSRALKIGFWERGVLGSQKDFVRAALGLPSAGAGTVAKIGGSFLDKPPILGGGGFTPIPGGPLKGLSGPNAGLGLDGVGKVNALGGFTLDDIPRVGSSLDTAVFVPSSSGLYTAHHGLGAYSFGDKLLGHEGLTNFAGTIGHTGVTPNIQWGSLQGVLDQALGNVTTHALGAGSLSSHALTGAVGDANTFTRAAVHLGEDVKMTPLPEVRRLTHGDTTLTSVSSERFVAAPAGSLAGRAPLPTSVHVPPQSLDGLTGKPIDARPTQLSTSSAPTDVKVTATDAFDLLAPGGGSLKATPTPTPTHVPNAGVSAGAGTGAHKDNALNLLAGGARDLDHVPAASARFAPMDLAGGHSVPVRADLAGSPGVVESATSLVHERVPLRAHPPTGSPGVPATAHPLAPTPPPTPGATPPVSPGVGVPPPPRTLAGFGHEQNAVVTRVLDDLATGPGPVGKSAQGLPESRIAAWQEWSRAKHDFEHAAAVEKGLKDRLTGGIGSSGGAGALHVDLMVAAAARANAGLALTDAAAALKAWGVDAAVVAPKVSEALAKLPGLRGGMRPHPEPALVPGSDVWHTPRPNGGYIEARPLAGNDGIYQMRPHPAGTGTTWELRAGPNPATSPVVGAATRLEPGVLKLDFHAPGATGTVDRFEVWTTSPEGVDTLTLTGERTSDGLYKVFEGPPTPTGDFQIWSNHDVVDRTLIHHVQALGDGRFQVFDGMWSEGGGFQIWDTADPATRTVLHDGRVLESGHWQVFDGPRSNGGRFEAWDTNTAGNHTVLHEGHPLETGGYQVFDGPRSNGGHFEIWDTYAAGNHTVLHEGHPLDTGGHQVFDGPRSEGGRFEIRDAHGNVTHTGAPVPGAGHFRVTDAVGEDFQIWNTADASVADSVRVVEGWHALGGDRFRMFEGPGADGGNFRILEQNGAGGHTVVHEGRALGDGRYQVFDGLVADGGNFRILADLDLAAPVVANAHAIGEGRYLVLDGPGAAGGASRVEIWDGAEYATHQVTHRGTLTPDGTQLRVDGLGGGRGFQVWDTSGAAPRVVHDGYAVGRGDLHQVFDGLRSEGGHFRVFHGSGLGAPVVRHGHAIGDGRYLVLDGPGATGGAGRVEIWNNAEYTTHHVTHRGTRTLDGTGFRVDGVDRTAGFQIWRDGDTGPRILKDAHPTTGGRYQVFDGLKADRAGFEVWADGTSRIGADGTVTGRTVTLRGTREGDDFRVVDVRRDTWEKWDGNDLTRHRLVEYPIDGPVAGATRRLDHSTGTWRDVYPGGGAPAHGVPWEHMPFRKGTIESWPVHADGSGGGIRKLVDDTGATVFTRDHSGIPDSGNWIEGVRDRTGKWTWVEKTVDGTPVTAGNRYVRWDDTSYDVANNVFGRNSRHYFGGTVRQNIPQTGGGMFVAEKVGLRDWSWQRWADNGDLLATGKLDFRLDQSLGFKARVEFVKLDGDVVPRRVTGTHTPVAFERFAPMRGSWKGDKFFSAADKARGTRQYTFDSQAASFDRQFRQYSEYNYVKEEVAKLDTFGGDTFKARRVWQQRAGVPSAYGRADFPGGLLSGEDRLMRYWKVHALGADWTKTGESALRFQRMSDASWQDFSKEGTLLRESRALSDGRKLEYRADAAPGATTDGWTTRGQWKETQAGATAEGYREFDASGKWRDVRTGDEGAGVVREVVDTKGTVREYGTPKPLGQAMPARVTDELGTWLDRNRLGQITASREEIGGNFVKATMDGRPDGRFTWTKENATGTLVTDSGPSTGYRTTNRAGAQMWGEGFDDGFKDFARVEGGEDVLVHERKLLGDGRFATIERVELGSGAFEYRTRVKTAAGDFEPTPGGHTVTHVDAGGAKWRDVITVRNAQGEDVTVTIRAGRGDAIREYHADTPGGVPSDRHWSDYRNGTRIRSFEPVRAADGTVVAYLEKDIAYLQSRIYDRAGDLVVHQSFSTKIFEKLADTDPGLLNKVRAKVSPDKVGTAGQVDGKFRLVGRGDDAGGVLNDARGYNRGMGDTNRRHWGPANGFDGSIEWSFGQKAWTKAGMEFMQDFGLSVLAGMITEWINDGDISGTDIGKIFLNAGVSASMAGVMARFHEAKFAPGTFSPKQFKDGLTANDWGKPFNTNPYFGDNWKTDWSNFDTALRWRSGMYKFGLGLAVNPFVAFVNGSINAAVFGDKNGVKHTGVDALKFGGVAALGSLASGAFGPGAWKFAADAYAAGRFWRKAGPLDIGIKLIEKIVDGQLNKLFQGWLDLAGKYDDFLNGPKP
ncbi:hypothetical protein [Streptomyces sp. SID3343]|uniref:hypothetical protein n=1 Tax=Streptomyces sp. SID3343 TaxID=2690260 RepID=UPI00136D0E00|nr:hypothetical protein [Streptomyces sp. SID3343]MYW01265.1 hypothetical protein [Streptomyces sp. SID3343]